MVGGVVSFNAFVREGAPAPCKTTRRLPTSPPRAGSARSGGLGKRRPARAVTAHRAAEPADAGTPDPPRAPTRRRRAIEPIVTE
jgi:hypothetical protein